MLLARVFGERPIVSASLLELLPVGERLRIKLADRAEKRAIRDGIRGPSPIPKLGG
jgi:hypothetical protein